MITSALALAACGGSSSKSSSGTAISSQPAATGTVPSQSTDSTPATTPTNPPGPATGNRCTAAKLALAFLGQQGATGHGVLGFALKNTSGTTCRTFGYPGVQFLSPSGGPLPTVSTRTTHDFGGSSKLAAISLASGATASFRLVVTHFRSSGSSKGCTTARALQVIPPDDTATLRVSIPGGAFECGTTTVSPLQAGTSAYP